MASSINSVVDSTGVKATLIFDKNAAGTKVLDAGATSAAWVSNLDLGTVGAATDGTNIRAFNTDASGERTASAGVSKISISTAGADKMEIGVNLDGDGRMYLRMVTNQKYEIYKDAAMTMPVATGSLTASFCASVTQECNDSGFNGVALTFSSPNAPAAGAVTTLQLGVEHEDTTIYPDALPVTASLFQHGGVRHNGEVFHVPVVQTGGVAGIDVHRGPAGVNRVEELLHVLPVGGIAQLRLVGVHGEEVDEGGLIRQRAHGLHASGQCGEGGGIGLVAEV